MRKQFTIWIVTPQGYVHSQAFTEWAEALRDGLLRLGHDAAITREPIRLAGRVIILGAHLLGHIQHRVEIDEDNVIVFNTEQLGPGSLMTPEFLGDLAASHERGLEVWDYSGTNIEYLKQFNIVARHCPLGYMPVLTKIESVAVEDIDVVFAGSVNERRQNILTALKDSGVGVVPIIGYGVWRDKYLARAKIVLNLHYYDAKIFEIFRCSYLMANSKCIVSETGLDKELETQYADGISFVGYGDIVDRVKELLADADERKRLARRGFEIFSAQSQTDILRELV